MAKCTSRWPRCVSTSLGSWVAESSLPCELCDNNGFNPFINRVQRFHILIHVIFTLKKTDKVH